MEKSQPRNNQLSAAMGRTGILEQVPAASEAQWSNISFYQEVCKGEGSKDDYYRSENIDWRSDCHVSIRQEMVERIMHVLLQRKSSSSPKAQLVLPHKSRRLEEALYKSASSLRVYADKNTLRRRLGKVAIAIANKHQKRMSEKKTVAETGSCFSVRRSSTDSFLSLTSSVSMPSCSSPITPIDSSTTQHQQQQNTTQDNATETGNNILLFPPKT
mmetsp:Transcript_1523/g.2286  ORF Transcript_1523/g.2286 Transcript_1523/m.2286 type:complete len:215 (+) Transcript_1523:157-801(+)|eukprot:CAMPEP_0195507730 /NCGR_PEP_ID=MMETSP0794_2-20130614/1120_1 /TAXON_ID=515487 /ORGANISM="Stephanopyxis turris, Strain CCMP 815" /LENGTH=214 /DNA_ID=CAMNT_0040634511 /DNA_START=156 /DNA_END=800 /DNA_ORIENTATION=+